MDGRGSGVSLHEKIIIYLKLKKSFRVMSVRAPHGDEKVLRK